MVVVVEDIDVLNPSELVVGALVLFIVIVVLFEIPVTLDELKFGFVVV